ncbi:MAG: hypothetical protein JWN15_1851 [Firmicutes bacterium]|nr:hypothetical protein [Bacillota bacterium]
MAKMNLARLKGLLGAPQAQLDPMEPDVDDQAMAQAQPPMPPRGKKVKRKLFGPPKQGPGAY